MTRSAIVMVGLAALMLCSGPAMAGVTIDGTITAGEWAGATTATIGNGGGTAYFFADTNYIYGAFDITGWTAAMGAASIRDGNLLGFGVWNADNSYPGNGVEFQQATDIVTWGGDGPSGTMNGLPSAFRIDAQSPPATSIPGDLQAMDSFATGHRVWEVRMPISTMTIIDDTVWVVGGINYDMARHWYPDTFLPNYKGYAPVPVAIGTAPVPEPLRMASEFLAIAGLGGYIRRRTRRAVA